MCGLAEPIEPDRIKGYARYQPEIIATGEEMPVLGSLAGSLHSRML